MYTQDTIVDVWPFTRQQEGQEFIIGRPDTGSFLAVSSEAVEVLDYLAEGRSVGEVAALSQNELSALEDFLSTLETQGIVKPVRIEGDRDWTGTHAVAPMRFHFGGFPQRVAQRIFSWPVLAATGVVIGLALLSLLRDPTLWPGARDLDFASHRTAMLGILVFFGYFSVVVHEASHVIAARAAGIDSRLGVGSRLWDFVIEADLSGLWSLPKRRRYLPIVAGSLLDALLAALIVLLLVARSHSWVTISPLTTQLLRAIMFTYMTRVMWQAFLFVRTDYYYVIANVFSCRNLMGDTEDFLRNQFAKVTSWIRPVDQSAIPAREKRVIHAFAVIWFVGRAIAIVFLFKVTIPVFGYYAGNLVHAVRAGYSANRGDFLDSLLMMGYFIPIIVGMGMWLTSIARRLSKMGA